MFYVHSYIGCTCLTFLHCEFETADVLTNQAAYLQSSLRTGSVKTVAMFCVVRWIEADLIIPSLPCDKTFTVSGGDQNQLIEKSTPLLCSVLSVIWLLSWSPQKPKWQCRDHSVVRLTTAPWHLSVVCCHFCANFSFQLVAPLATKCSGSALLWQVPPTSQSLRCPLECCLMATAQISVHPQTQTGLVQCNNNRQVSHTCHSLVTHSLTLLDFNASRLNHTKPTWPVVAPFFLRCLGLLIRRVP